MAPVGAIRRLRWKSPSLMRIRVSKRVAAMVAMLQKFILDQLSALTYSESL